jgi:hypothetical protein
MNKKIVAVLIVIVLIIIAVVWLFKKKSNNPTATFYSGPNKTGQSFSMMNPEGEYTVPISNRRFVVNESVTIPFVPESVELPDDMDLCFVNEDSDEDALGVCLDDFVDPETIETCKNNVFSSECLNAATKDGGDVTSVVVVPKEPKGFVFYSQPEKQGQSFVAGIVPGVYIFNPNVDDAQIDYTELPFLPQSIKLQRGYRIIFLVPGMESTPLNYRANGYPPTSCVLNLFDSTNPNCINVPLDSTGRYRFHIVQDKFTMPEGGRLKDLPQAREKIPALPKPGTKKSKNK